MERVGCPSCSELDVINQRHGSCWPNLTFTTTDAVAKEESTLTLEKLLRTKTELDRKSMIYVIASDMVPDDAYGVLFVRQEDARKWNAQKNKKYNSKVD